MSVKLGVAPIAWSNDDMPELGGETTLDQCLSEANQAGYIGVEFGGKFPKNSEELIPKLDKYKIDLCGGWYGANLRKNTVNEEREHLRSQLNLFKDCNSPCIVFAEVSGSIQGDQKRKLSTRPKMDNDEWKSFSYKISEMGKYLEDEGMPLAYHHHMGTVIETEADTMRLLDNTNDSVKLTLDTGHMLFAQGDYQKILDRFSPSTLLLTNIQTANAPIVSAFSAKNVAVCCHDTEGFFESQEKEKIRFIIHSAKMKWNMFLFISASGNRMPRRHPGPDHRSHPRPCPVLSGPKWRPL